MDNIELNKKLYNECQKEVLDIEKIENLIDMGANPEGRISNQYEYETLYESLIELCLDSKSDNLLVITKIFLKHGMKIDASKYDEDNINPLWELAFETSELGIKTLKLLLDAQIDVNSIYEIVDHLETDDIFFYFNDDFSYIIEPNEDESFKYAIKMIMLCAAYEYVVKDCELLRNIIEIDKNNYDLSKFKEYYNYDVKYENEYILICDKKSNEIVWKFHK